MLGYAGSGRRFSAVDSFVGIPLLYVVVKAIVDENLGIPDDGKFIFVKLPKGRLYDGVMHSWLRYTTVAAAIPGTYAIVSEVVGREP